ncbi:sensor histidine kinase [Kribbella sp. DT2]|uniref:sensor histidine kinase n=1 Tax=Kribbella sp. DT2 TaxID=3393427 RepID=UPI003CE7A19A
MEPGRPTRAPGIGLAAGTVAVLLTSLLFVAGAPEKATLIAPAAITAIAIAIAVWAVVRSRRQRRDYEERLTTWAGEQAVQAERLRIARDLHDLVSHGLGLITIRAAVARRAGAGNGAAAAAGQDTVAGEAATGQGAVAGRGVAGQDAVTGEAATGQGAVAGPGAAGQDAVTGQDAARQGVAGQGVASSDTVAGLTAALTDIEQVSRGTTTELRRMLNVLRSADGEPAPLRPAETLADLPAIVDEARAAGLRVALDLPDLPEVSPGVQLTICAVVREVLNNTLRHSGPTRAELAVRRQGGVLETSCRDDGPVGGWVAH